MEKYTDKELMEAIKQGKVVICPACGQQNAPANKFCRACGHALVSNKAAAFAPLNGSSVPTPDKTSTAGATVTAGTSSPAFAASNVTPATTQAATAVPKAPAFQVHLMQPQEEEPPQHNAFAEGLPDWNIEPPQVVIRHSKT